MKPRRISARARRRATTTLETILVGAVIVVFSAGAAFGLSGFLESASSEMGARLVGASSGELALASPRAPAPGAAATVRALEEGRRPSAELDGTDPARPAAASQRAALAALGSDARGRTPGSFNPAAGESDEAARRAALLAGLRVEGSNAARLVTVADHTYELLSRSMPHEEAMARARRILLTSFRVDRDPGMTAMWFGEAPSYGSGLLVQYGDPDDPRYAVLTNAHVAEDNSTYTLDNGFVAFEASESWRNRDWLDGRAAFERADVSDACLEDDWCLERSWAHRNHDVAVLRLDPEELDPALRDEVLAMAWTADELRSTSPGAFTVGYPSREASFSEGVHTSNAWVKRLFGGDQAGWAAWIDARKALGIEHEFLRKDVAPWKESFSGNSGGGVFNDRGEPVGLMSVGIPGILDETGFHQENDRYIGYLPMGSVARALEGSGVELEAPPPAPPRPEEPPPGPTDPFELPEPAFDGFRFMVPSRNAD